MATRRLRKSSSGPGALLLLILISLVWGGRGKLVQRAGAAQSQAKPRARGFRVFLAILVPLVTVGALSLPLHFWGDPDDVAEFLDFLTDGGVVLAFSGAMAALLQHNFSAPNAPATDEVEGATRNRFMMISLYAAAVGALMIAIDGGVGLFDHFFSRE